MKRVVNGCTFYRKDLHLICHKVPGSPSVYIAFFLSCIFFSKINSCHSSISDGKIFNLISIKFATLLWNFLYSHINKFGLLKKKNGVAQWRRTFFYLWVIILKKKKLAYSFFMQLINIIIIYHSCTLKSSILLTILKFKLISEIWKFLFCLCCTVL